MIKTFSIFPLRMFNFTTIHYNQFAIRFICLSPGLNYSISLKDLNTYLPIISTILMICITSYFLYK